MAVFPALNPASRSFTPGTYPNSGYDGLSGVSNRTRNSNVMLGSQLRLSFAAISEADMLAILAHYKGQRGSFESFPLPSIVWNGGGDASNYQLTGYGWIYNEPPTVVDYPCGFHDVDLTLETVPPEGTTLLGLDQQVIASISGSAFAFNGVDLVVAATLEPGVAGPGGLDSVVTCSLSAGTPTAGSTASGFNLFVTVSFKKGPDSFGLTGTVAVTFEPGQPTDDLLGDWVAQTFGWQEGVFLDWWGT